LASANLEFDRDIVCPCDYRDPDVQEFGACYCRLYVNKEVHESKELPAVPERRPMEKQALAYSAAARPGEKKTQQATTMESPKEGAGVTPQLKPKLWYCRQCGYVVYRDEPPYVCPICKAKKELFAEITIRIDFLG
jgi:rubrerythrin